jgi:tetratricopeptide (TPR) repeat protein
VSLRAASRLLVAALATILPCSCERDAAAPPTAGGFAGDPRSRLDAPLAKPAKGDAAKAAPLVDAARRAAVAGQPLEAHKLLEQALVADPSCVDALLLRGNLLLEKSSGYMPSVAITCYRLALLVDPANVAARVGEAVTRVELSDDERARTQLVALLDDEGAQRLVLAIPQRAAVHRSLGRVALRAGRSDEARREVDAALALNANDRNALVLRSEVDERDGRDDAALAGLDAAIALRPDSAAPHFARARVLRRLGRTADADRETRIHRALLPFEEEGAKEFATDWPRRIALRRELVDAWPEFRRARHVLVRELIAGRELDAARAELGKLVAEDATDGEAWFLMARASARAGDAAAARAAADKMLATGRSSQAVYDDLLREIEKGRDEGKK